MSYSLLAVCFGLRDYLFNEPFSGGLLPADLEPATFGGR
jgi:hypothetical protein